MTGKQDKAIKTLMNTNASKGEAMRKAGYSKSVSRQPKVLTESVAFKKALEKHLSVDKLMSKHDKALGATKHVLLEDGNMIEVDDHPTILKAVKMGYEIRGIGAAQPIHNAQVNIVIPTTGFIPDNNALDIKPTKR